jgi:hypothetical protein
LLIQHTNPSRDFHRLPSNNNTNNNNNNNHQLPS